MITLPKYRYNELTLVSRIWVHLRQIRRGGGAHIPGGFNALTPGSLALECPACPHPGKNIITPSADRLIDFYLSGFLRAELNFTHVQLAKYPLPLHGRELQVETEGERIQRPSTCEWSRVHDIERRPQSALS